MVVQAFWEADVIEYQPCPRALRLKFELRYRIGPFRPGHDAPDLNDPLIREQFHVPPDDVAAKKRERPADFSIDFRWPAGEGRELVGV